MANRRIHIDTLSIRLPQGMKRKAHSFAGGLGREIIQSIAGASQGKTGERRFNHISVGTIKASREESAIRKRAVTAIMTEVKKRLG